MLFLAVDQFVNVASATGAFGEENSFLGDGGEGCAAVQDYFPDWFDKQYRESRFRATLKSTHTNLHTLIANDICTIAHLLSKDSDML